MFWSDDSAHTFHNVSGYSNSQSGHSSPLLVTPFHFDSSVEGSSWSLLELPTGSGGMPAGVFHFTAQTIWHSDTSARTWRWFADAHAVSNPSSAIYEYPYGADSDAGFFMQSEVYRREDGTFLHGCRVPTHSNTCDNWDGSQLWKSHDTRGTEWACASQAAAGYCTNATWKARMHDSVPCNWDAKGLTPRNGSSRYIDRCANMTDAPFLRPGSMYTHFLKLMDGRLLLTWTKRSPKYDNDGFGSGIRGLLSYDDGSTFDTSEDYIVIQAQNDSWSPACRAGCGCHVGYGNTLQLANGTLVTAYCHDPEPGQSGLARVAVVRWNLG